MARSAYFESFSELWQQPNFSWYMGGQTVALVGMWAQKIAIGWLTWELTRSNFWLGAIAFADLFPTVLGYLDVPLPEGLDGKQLVESNQRDHTRFVWRFLYRCHDGDSSGNGRHDPSYYRRG